MKTKENIMKKIFQTAFTLLLCIGAVYAAVVYSGYLVNDPAISYDQTYTVNLNTTPNSAGMHIISAQAVYSSSTISAATFTDGRVSTGSVTVVSAVALSSAIATNQITLNNIAGLVPTPSTNTITVVSTSGLTGAVITFNGKALRNGTDWFAVPTASATARSIAAALNHFSTVVSTNVAGVVYATSTATGLTANNLTLSSSTGSITVGSQKFKGGRDSAIKNAYIVANGVTLKQGWNWYVRNTAAATATSIATVLDRVAGINASAAGNVVYATATASGLTPNSYTLVSSSSGYISVLTPTFTGGRANAVVTINGYSVTQGTDWTAVATTTGTAQAITNAINAKTGLNSIVTATRSSSAVNLASNGVGTATTYMLTATPSALTASGVTMIGGLNSGITLNSPTISITNHGLATGLAVLYSTGTVAISGLTNGTTYYAHKVDANSIKLSTSKSNSITGPYITIASTSTTGPHTYTLTPLAITGTPGFFWEVSNNNVDYNPINISSVTFSSPYTAASTQWDFGTVPQKYLRLNVTAPTTGGLNLKVLLNGSN